MSEKKQAVLATYTVAVPYPSQMPVVGQHWQHPLFPEVRGLCNEVRVEDRTFETVWVAVIARWILE